MSYTNLGRQVSFAVYLHWGNSWGGVVKARKTKQQFGEGKGQGTNVKGTDGERDKEGTVGVGSQGKAFLSAISCHCLPTCLLLPVSLLQAHCHGQPSPGQPKHIGMSLEGNVCLKAPPLPTNTGEGFLHRCRFPARTSFQPSRASPVNIRFPPWGRTEK